MGASWSGEPPSDAPKRRHTALVLGVSVVAAALAMELAAGQIPRLPNVLVASPPSTATVKGTVATLLSALEHGRPRHPAAHRFVLIAFVDPASPDGSAQLAGAEHDAQTLAGSGVQVVVVATQQPAPAPGMREPPGGASIPPTTSIVAGPAQVSAASLVVDQATPGGTAVVVDQTAAVAAALGVRQMPAAVLVSADGAVVGRAHDPVSAVAMLATVLASGQHRHRHHRHHHRVSPNVIRRQSGPGTTSVPTTSERVTSGAPTATTEPTATTATGSGTGSGSSTSNGVTQTTAGTATTCPPATTGAPPATTGGTATNCSTPSAGPPATTGDPSTTSAPPSTAGSTSTTGTGGTSGTTPPA